MNYVCLVSLFLLKPETTGLRIMSVPVKPET